jgi:ubiquinone biosynthesis protein
MGHMSDSAPVADSRLLTPEKLRSAIADFLPKGSTQGERISAIETALGSVVGQSMRQAMAEWIVDGIVPVSRLVPDAYAGWRPPVRDAMMFVVQRLSPGRLAPKLLEQFELPENTPAEVRLLRLIAKVPGLQKLGQVIARNQHLRPALRNALARLENGIRDVEPAEIRAIIQQDLATRLKKYDVDIASGILSEASVSAVLRFTWRNPASGRRERGVFKVLKPHIRDYFAEDMDYLQGLAQYFGDRHHGYGFPPNLIPDTFKKVRRLLQHEVNFDREQKTLNEAGNLYRGLVGVRIPQLIPSLCSPRITALTEERGAKITNATKRLSAARRKRVAEQLVEALVAFPLLSSQEDVIFHGDPHAGNLLYNHRTGELSIIDWALRERLSRDQRRHLVVLLAMTGLRDPAGARNAVLALSQRRRHSSAETSQVVAQEVSRFFDELPASSLPSMVDVMRLLERIAFAGVRFPASLIILSKVMFTLDGILRDLGASETSMGIPIARQLALHWLTDRKAFRSPLKAKDWVALQCSALLYTSRLWMRCEQGIFDRLLPVSSNASTSAS